MRTEGAFTLVVIATAVAVGCGFKTNPRPASATIPGEVGVVSAQAYPQRIVLTWDVPTTNIDGSLLKDLSGFKVYRSVQQIGEECDNCEHTENVYANVDIQNPPNAVINQNEVVYTDKGVKQGTIYHYIVTSYNLRGRESLRSQVVTVVFDEPPPPPTEVQASADARGIVLRWEQPARLSGIRSYRIYRGTTSDVAEMKSVGHTRWAETYFVDRDVEEGKTYFYTVRSIKINRGIFFESSPSAVVTETRSKVDLEPPEQVNTASTKEGIRVYWNPAGSRDAETRYNVYRSDSGRIFNRINEEPLRNAWFMDKGVVRGKKYTYGVTAFAEGKPGNESRRTVSDTVEYIP